MSDFDCILVQTKKPKVIQPCLADFEGRADAIFPTERTVRVVEIEKHHYLLTFTPRLGAIQFVNVIGSLADWKGVLDCTGWVRGLDGVRYMLRPHHKEEDPPHTAFLRGSDHRGRGVEVLLYEGWMCEITEAMAYREPPQESSLGKSFTFGVTFDRDYLPRLVRTHEKDFDWPIS